jgi:flagellar motor switch protein FliM
VGLTATDIGPAHRLAGALPDPGYGAQLQIGSPGQASLVACSARLAMELLADMLGVSQDLPEDEEAAAEGLSPVEMSMLELLFGEVARAIALAWPALETLECQLQNIVRRPLRTRLFAPDAVLVQTKFHVASAHGEDDMIWLVEAEALQQSLSDLPVTDHKPVVQHAPELRQLAEQFCMALVVELGQVRLSLGELERLAPGDVLVLDQSASSPLRAKLGGVTHCFGTPCRVGVRQGFRVQSTGDTGEP